MSVESGGFRVVLTEMSPQEIFNNLDGQFKKCHEKSHLDRVFRWVKNMEKETSSSVETYQHDRVPIKNLNALKHQCIAFSLVYTKIQKEFERFMALAKSQENGIQLLRTLASDHELKGDSSKSSAKSEQETELDKQLKILKNQSEQVTETSQSMELVIRIVEQKLKIFNALVENKGPLSITQLEEMVGSPFINFRVVVIDKDTIHTLIKDIGGRPSYLQIPASNSPSRTSSSSPNIFLTPGKAKTAPRSPGTASPTETQTSD